MKKFMVRMLLALCFVFGLMSATDGNLIAGNDMSVVYAGGKNDPTGSDPAGGTTPSTEKQQIEGTGDETLNITVGSDGKLQGGIVSKDGKASTEDTGNKILGTLSTVFTFVLAGATIVLGIIFIIHCVSLAKDGNNPQGKSSSINGLIMTAIAAVLCGGACVFIGLFFNVFR